MMTTAFCYIDKESFFFLYVQGDAERNTDEFIDFESTMSLDCHLAFELLVADCSKQMW